MSQDLGVDPTEIAGAETDVSLPTAGSPQVQAALRMLKQDEDGPLQAPKETPLTSFERAVLNGLATAVESGNVADSQSMLAGIARLGRETQRRVLGAFRSQLERQDQSGLTQVRWETGTNSEEGAFVRARISRNNDHSKSSGRTSVMIGSDGLNVANYTRMYNSQPVTMSADAALSNINGGIAGSWKHHRQERESAGQASSDAMKRAIEQWQRRLKPEEE